jgi:transposase-like protein
LAFVPPFCPNPCCDKHKRPCARFYVRFGSFRVACRPEPVARFRCQTCRRTFSTQTFRQDYRDRRPELNGRVFEHLASGVGLRQCARRLRIGVSALQRKACKIARQMQLLHDNLSHRMPSRSVFVLDEEETFETASIRRVGIAMVVEQRSWFIVTTAVGSLRRLAKPGTARRRWQDRDEQRHGKRADESSKCVRAALQALRDKVGDRPITLLSDRKASYARIAKQVFGDRVRHERTSGKDPRTPRNPLFPINSMQAVSRDLVGALRRQSWLHAKKAVRLSARLAIFVVYKNYERKRFNTDKEDKSPAVHLGLISRSLTTAESLRWRQDFGLHSIHPLSCDGARRVGESESPAAIGA